MKNCEDGEGRELAHSHFEEPDHIFPGTTDKTHEKLELQ
jgi:hypothetical protein